MKQVIYRVKSNRQIAPSTFELLLDGDTSDIKGPGQFVNIKLDGFFLRRPISVADRADGELTLLYKVVGGGTEAMAELAAGAELDVLTGLGNGFDIEKSTDKPLLIGGGIGCAPLYLLCRELCRRGIRPQVLLGFNTAEEIYYEEEFRRLTPHVTVVTADGSRGKAGLVTDALPDEYEYFYACGPTPMLRTLADRVKTRGQYSLEERMGCGFGACMGCSCKTKNGPKRVCKEGPVMESEEMIW